MRTPHDPARLGLPTTAALVADVAGDQAGNLLLVAAALLLAAAALGSVVVGSVTRRLAGHP